MADDKTTLLIHMGGLGDICLSESTFLSLNRHFSGTIEALGRKSVLDLFRMYFVSTDSIDRREWIHLFAGTPTLLKWETIIFVGKDRTGGFRRRLRAMAREVIFIDMYPDGQKVHVEAYQLEQLSGYGITALVKEFRKRPGDRVIIYPEPPFMKRKWPVERFLSVYSRLKERAVRLVLVRPPDLELPVSGARTFHELEEVGRFFSETGGVFFSNDSGMAHLAAHYGLATFTLFCDTDPLVWHPKGSRYLQCDEEQPTVEHIAELIWSAANDLCATAN